MIGSAGVVLDAVDLYKFYRAAEEETVALREVSMRVRPGELICVAGPSGSGKSTLLACLAGLDEPDAGMVRVDGVPISHRPEPQRAQIRAQHVGVMFPTGNLLDCFTLYGNITFLHRARRGQPPRRTAADLLDRVGLYARRGAFPNELSGGELVRAGLAVAMAHTPAILLADEPTGQLDIGTEAKICLLLRVLTTDGTAVVVASHSPAVSAAADRTMHLRDGRIHDGHS